MHYKFILILLWIFFLIHLSFLYYHLFHFNWFEFLIEWFLVKQHQLYSLQNEISFNRIDRTDSNKKPFYIWVFFLYICRIKHWSIQSKNACKKNDLISTKMTEKHITNSAKLCQYIAKMRKKRRYIKTCF